MTDNELIRGIRENSDAAWREIYHANYGRLRAKVEPMLAGVKALTFDDVYDEALLALMDNVKDGSLAEGEHTNLSGYLYTVCWRIALRQAARGRKEETESRKAGRGAVPADGPEGEDLSVEPWEYEEALAFLDRVLGSMSPQCRSIFRRFYWDRLPMSEIAAIHGLRNANSAKTTKNRCMDKFKQIARDLLADDAKAEEAVRRTVERDALRDLLKEFRKERSGEWARAALDENDRGGE